MTAIQNQKDSQIEIISALSTMRSQSPTNKFAPCNCQILIIILFVRLLVGRIRTQFPVALKSFRFAGKLGRLLNGRRATAPSVVLDVKRNRKYLRAVEQCAIEKRSESIFSNRAAPSSVMRQQPFRALSPAF